MSDAHPEQDVLPPEPPEGAPPMVNGSTEADHVVMSNGDYEHENVEVKIESEPVHDRPTAITPTPASPSSTTAAVPLPPSTTNLSLTGPLLNTIPSALDPLAQPPSPAAISADDHIATPTHPTAPMSQPAAPVASPAANSSPARGATPVAPTSVAANLPPSVIIPPAAAGGSATRVYLNARVTPHLLEGMKWVAANEPEKPLKWLAEFLGRKSAEVEGPS